MSNENHNGRRRRSHEELAAALGPSGVMSAYRAMGVVFAHDEPRASGIVECYGFGRDDRLPSAYVDTAKGTYRDSGGESVREVSLSQFAADAGFFPSWKDAFDHYAADCGLDAGRSGIPKPSTNGQAHNAHNGRAGASRKSPRKPAEDPTSVLKFEEWTDGQRIRVKRWIDQHKPGLSVQAIEANGGRVGRYHGRTWVVGLPIYGEQDGESLAQAASAMLSAGPIGWVIWSLDPKNHPLRAGRGEKRHDVKMKTVGSANGIVGRRFLERLAVDSEEAFGVVWKTEGPGDMLALEGIIPDEQRSRIGVWTNAGGCEQFNAWMALLVCGSRVNVVHDADEPGQRAAIKACSAIDLPSMGVCNVLLPYPIEPKHGKDCRDFVNDGYSYADLVALADAAPAFEAPEEPEAMTTSAIDVPAPTIWERFGNAKEAEEPDDDGKPTFKPAMMVEVIGKLNSRTGGLPYRVGNTLFVPGQNRDVCWLESTSALFGWLQTQLGVVDWRRGTGYVTKDEFFAELCRSAKAFEAVETVPHVPPRADTHYTWLPKTAGDGSTLRTLLDRFAPATPVDGDLILSMLATLVWGGGSGLRPAFVITSNAGRGAGKSTVAKMLGHVVGGAMEFSQEEAAAEIKTRLLSTEGLGHRFCLLDNVKSHKFSWAELEALITAPAISGKRLFKGEGRRPNTLTWAITLNGASLSRDMAQRSVIIKVEKPNRSATWEDDTTAFVLASRDAIVADLVGFFESQPADLLKPTRWATWEAAVLARLPDPSEAQKVIAERQAAVDVDNEEASQLQAHFREQLEDLNYDVDAEPVFIRSLVAASWYREAMGDHKSPTAVTRIVNQWHDEGTLTRLKVSPGRTHGRGLLWLPINDGEQIRVDLESRIERRRLDRLTDEARARNEARGF